jgi:RHS repeat-associated protein
VIQRTILTAFGEPLLPSPPEGEGQGEGGAGNTRYGYAGAWGYESAEQSFDPLTDLGWLHVGERYYDPAIGRFMQRDPIGIRGGLNVYEYVRSRPVRSIDPDGLDAYSDIDDVIDSLVDMGGAAAATAAALNYKYKLAIGRIANRFSAACAGAYIGRKIGEFLVAHTAIEDYGAYGLIAAERIITLPGIVVKPKPALDPLNPGMVSCLEGCHDGTR